MLVPPLPLRNSIGMKCFDSGNTEMGTEIMQRIAMSMLGVPGLSGYNLVRGNVSA
jgi:hypothetical protein